MKRSITSFEGNLYQHLETTEEEQKAQEGLRLSISQDVLINVQLSPPQRQNTLPLDASDGENKNDDGYDGETNDGGGGGEGEDDDEDEDETTRGAIELLDDDWVLEVKNIDKDTPYTAIQKVSAAKNICDLSFRTLS
jgi:hypothetical protein